MRALSGLALDTVARPKKVKQVLKRMSGKYKEDADIFSQIFFLSASILFSVNYANHSVNILYQGQLIGENCDVHDGISATQLR